MKRTDHTALKLGDTATAAVAGRLLPNPSPRPITHCVQHVASLLAICLMLTIHTFSHAQAQVPPGGVPLFGENPLAAFNFEGETDSDGAAALVLANGQPFSEALRVRVQRKPSNPGRIRLNLSDGTVAPVAAGDVTLGLAAKRFMSFSGRPHVLEPQKGPDCATIQHL